MCRGGVGFESGTTQHLTLIVKIFRKLKPYTKRCTVITYGQGRAIKGLVVC